MSESYLRAVAQRAADLLEQPSSSDSGDHASTATAQPDLARFEHTALQVAVSTRRVSAHSPTPSQLPVHSRRRRRQRPSPPVVERLLMEL